MGIFLFTTASRPALGPTQPPIFWVPGVLSLWVKWSEREADHSPPSSAEVKDPFPHYAFTYHRSKSAGTVHNCQQFLQIPLCPGANTTGPEHSPHVSCCWYPDQTVQRFRRFEQVRLAYTCLELPHVKDDWFLSRCSDRLQAFNCN
jgi:hypothetical protein